MRQIATIQAQEANDTLDLFDFDNNAEKPYQRNAPHFDFEGAAFKPTTGKRARTSQPTMTVTEKAVRFNTPACDAFGNEAYQYVRFVFNKGKMGMQFSTYKQSDVFHLQDDGKGKKVSSVTLAQEIRRRVNVDPDMNLIFEFEHVKNNIFQIDLKKFEETKRGTRKRKED
jgi:hypothetical protein